jgi:phosphatidylethanolamine-binding protein (PEBP) family uncharacterized protein
MWKFILGPTKITTLLIKYGGQLINKGDNLLPSYTWSSPIIYYDFEPNIYYTLIMFDPTRLIDGYWLHWIVGNIINYNGDDIIQYSGITQLINYKHKYIFILYKQFEKCDYNNISQDRAHFNVTDFMTKYNLKPVAMTHFICINAYN